MIQALLNFDLESLYRALRQDAAILIAMAALGAVLWRRVGFALTGRALVLDMGILVRRRVSFARRDIAVLEQDRPLWLRLAGGSRVTVYMARGRGRNRATFYLPRRQAAALAEALLPVDSEAVLFAPTRAERVRLTMLSANIAATAALVLVSLRQTRRILGAGLEQKLNDLALGQLAQVEKLLELVLPAGAAWLVTLVFALWGVALFASLLSTSGFKVCRSGGVILAKGGRVNHSERRIAASAVSACDVRLTPAGRLLGRRAVYLSAGSYRGGDIPVLVYKRGAEALVQALVPQFAPPPYSPEVLAGRSLPLFLWKGGAAFAFFGALMGVSLWKMPRLTPLLALPLLLCLGLLLAGLEAWVTEGVWQTPGGTLAVQYTRGYTRHTVYLLTADLSLTCRQTPFSESVGRCDLIACLPCRARVKARAVKYARAVRLKLVP
ncbi:PH domain-containing protein [Candidatus Allofournierella excrementigallinarum]|uniref:PH domain-containing protein n=1 Tax=Candidatus Allofournierella excrementigallinarum TaxID=2838592 RepID=UPI00374F158D